MGPTPSQSKKSRASEADVSLYLNDVENESLNSRRYHLIKRLLLDVVLHWGSRHNNHLTRGGGLLTSYDH